MKRDIAQAVVTKVGYNFIPGGRLIFIVEASVDPLILMDLQTFFHELDSVAEGDILKVTFDEELNRPFVEVLVQGQGERVPFGSIAICPVCGEAIYRSMDVFYCLNDTCPTRVRAYFRNLLMILNSRVQFSDLELMILDKYVVSTWQSNKSPSKIFSIDPVSITDSSYKFFYNNAQELVAKLESTKQQVSWDSYVNALSLPNANIFTHVESRIPNVDDFLRTLQDFPALLPYGNTHRNDLLYYFSLPMNYALAKDLEHNHVFIGS